MKQIGKLFKEKREEIGISIAEESKDLKIEEVLIENLENGNFKAFKDILELKSVSISLAKYLGIDEEKVLDEINDFIFEKTSKISLNDIQKAYKEETKEPKKIKSPYTIEKEVKPKNSLFIIVLITCLTLVILYFIFRYIAIK